MSRERQTYTVDEAAEIIGIGRSSTYEAIQRGQIPALRFGRRVVIPKAAFDELLRNTNSETAPADENAIRLSPRRQSRKSR